MTLLVRDEQDIVRQNLDFHLAHGVDFVVATDNGSTDGTRDILAEYERLGVLHLIDEPVHDYSQWKWVTRMALLARDRFGADWVLNNDADEFWLPAGHDLKVALDGTIEDVLHCRRLNLFGRDDESWTDWPANLVYRVARPLGHTTIGALADDEVVAEPYLYAELMPKALCRARGLRSVTQGNHDADYGRPRSARGIDDIVIHHFPVRSFEQFCRKIENGGAAYARNADLPAGQGAHWRRWYRMFERGEHQRAFREVVPPPDRLARDLRSGAVVVDRRLQHRLASRPT